MPSASSSSALTLAFALALAATTNAQLPAWTTLPSAAPSSIASEASIVLVTDAAGMHAWSSYTRVWSDLATTPSATAHVFDDHVVVVDGNTAHGYASRDGVWRPQPLANPASVATPAGGPVWVTAIPDGNDVHVFSGLLGTWATASFNGAPTVAVARMVAVLGDGQQTCAVSAHFGDIVPLGIAGVTSLDAVGCVGAARDASYQHVFSAYRDRWRSIPASAAATLQKPPSRAGYVVVREPDTMTFYSALTDDQVLLLVDQQATLTLEADVAAVQAGNLIVAYSCSAGTVDTITSPSGNALVEVEQELVVVVDGNDVHAFGLVDALFAPLPDALLIGSSTGAALALSLVTGEYVAFSCMTNAWQPAPAGTYSSSYVNYNGVVLVDQAGVLQGFSGNRGTWSAQPAPVPTNVFRHKAAFCAQSGSRLDTFNGRTGAWRTLTTTAPANVSVFDMSVMADDGQSVHCYSCYTDDWSSLPIVAQQSELRDECAVVAGGGAVHTWSGSCQVSEWANMPEYWRILARGSSAHYDVAGEPGELAFLAVSTAPADLPTPWGTLHLDPAQAAVAPLVIPDHGCAHLTLPVPESPALRGLTLWSQALVYAPTLGGFYLTGYFESTIL